MSSILDDEDEVMDTIGQTTFEDKIKEVMTKYPIEEHSKDAFGHKLEVGDYVIYMCPHNGVSGTRIYKASLLLGQVKKICPKRISVDTWVEAKHNWFTINRAFKGHKIGLYNYKVCSDKLIKIDNIDEFIKDL